MSLAIPRLAALCAAALVAAVPLRASFAAPAAWAYKLAPGDRLTYQLDYRSTSELNFGGLLKGKKGPAQGHGGNSDNESAPQKIKVSLKGELIETVLAQKDGETTVSFALQSPAITIVANGEAADDQAQALQQGLAKQVLAQLDAQGRILGLRFDDGVPPEVQLAARSLYSLTQVVLPAGEATPRTWKTQEVEPNGEYTARYTQAGKDKGGLRLVKKRKLAFAEEAPAEGPHEITVKKQIKPTGSLSAHFDAGQGRVAAIAGEDAQEVLLNDRAIGHAVVKFKLTLAKSVKLAAGELSPLAQAAAARAKAPLVALKTVESKEQAESAIQQNELKDETPDQVFAELQKLEEGSGDEQPVYLKVKAMLSVKPETAQRAGELLAKAKEGGPTVRILSGALGTVGSEQAQTALAKAAKARPPDDQALSNILPALGELAKPLPVAEDALRSLAMAPGEGDAVSTARLALGTMAAALAKQEPARAKKIVDDLSGMLAKKPGEETSRQLLLALGNSGSPDALPVLQAAVGDQSAILREAAVKALGQVASPEADKLLHGAARDADEHVRKAATDALAARKKG